MNFAYMYKEIFTFNVNLYSHYALGICDVTTSILITVYIGTSNHAFEYIIVRFMESGNPHFLDRIYIYCIDNRI